MDLRPNLTRRTLYRHRRHSLTLLPPYKRHTQGLRKQSIYYHSACRRYRFPHDHYRKVPKLTTPCIVQNKGKVRGLDDDTLSPFGIDL